jgi:hypothetical protein
MNGENPSTLSMLLDRLIPCGMILLRSGVVSAPAGEGQSKSTYSFPAVENLPDKAMMPKEMLA